MSWRERLEQTLRQAGGLRQYGWQRGRMAFRPSDIAQGRGAFVLSETFLTGHSGIRADMEVPEFNMRGGEIPQKEGET